MSIGLQSLIWKVGPDSKAELLLLLALAEHANDSGYAYPGVALLAKKSRDTPRNVLRVLPKLVAHGWLSIENECGKGNKYQIAISKIVGRALFTGEKFSKEEKKVIALTGGKLSQVDQVPPLTFRDDTPDISGNEPLTFRDDTPDISGNEPLTFRDDTPDISGSLYRGTIKEPSVEPSVKQSSTPCGVEELFLELVPIAAKRSDPRHRQFVSALSRYYRDVAGIDLPTGPADFKQLKNLLEANPSLTVENFNTILEHREQSAGIAHAQRPAEWLPSATSFLSGPLDRFNKLAAPRETNHGKPSKRENIVDSDRKARQFFAEQDILDSDPHRYGGSDEARCSARPRIEGPTGQAVAADAGFSWGRAL